MGLVDKTFVRNRLDGCLTFCQQTERMCIMNKNIAIFIATAAALALFSTGCVTSGYDTVYTTVPYAEEPVYVPTTYGQPTYIETVSPAYIHTTVIDVDPPPPRYHGHSYRHHPPTPRMERNSRQTHHRSRPATGSRPSSSRSTSSRPSVSRPVNSRSGGSRPTADATRPSSKSSAVTRSRSVPARNETSRPQGKGARPRSGNSGRTSSGRNHRR